jgi:hypothetical protein
MLLRFDVGYPRSLLAEAQKTPNLVTQVGQGFVLGFAVHSRFPL